MASKFLLESPPPFPLHAPGDSISALNVAYSPVASVLSQEVSIGNAFGRGSTDSSGYPDNNPKTAAGLQKCPLDLVPPALMRGAAEAFKNGADKYGAYNWREKQISSSVYYAAALRHLSDWWDRVDADDCAPDSRIHHLKHAAACIAMLLDTMGSPLLNDNRPVGVKRVAQNSNA